MMLEAFPWRLEACRSWGAKKEQRPHRVAKRVPKRNPNSLKMPTFGILVLKV